MKGLNVAGSSVVTTVMKDHNSFVFGVEQSRVKAFLNCFTPKVKAL
jgi:hypothetical protein